MARGMGSQHQDGLPQVDGAVGDQVAAALGGGGQQVLSPERAMPRAMKPWPRAMQVPRPCGCPQKCGRMLEWGIGQRARALKYHPECPYPAEARRARDRARDFSAAGKRARAEKREKLRVEAEKRAALRALRAPAARSVTGICDICSDLPHRIPAGTRCAGCNMMSGVHKGDTGAFIRNQALRKLGAA